VASVASVAASVASVAVAWASVGLGVGFYNESERMDTRCEHKI